MRLPCTAVNGLIDIVPVSEIISLNGSKGQSALARQPERQQAFEKLVRLMARQAAAEYVEALRSVTPAE